MNFEIDTVKGFQDFLPPESLKREAIIKVIKKYFKLYGFKLVETPIVEFDELMRTDLADDEDEAVSDRFKLKDRGGRNLGLRYEFTFQLARIFKQNPNIKLPFRRYQIGPIFRDEPISFGRFRQFTQCDADIVGDSSVNADAELLALVSDILKELKIDIEIQVNSRKLLQSLIESVEIQNIKGVMRELDKIEKLGQDAVKTNLRKYTSANQVLTLFKLLEKNIEFYKENAFDGAVELESLVDICKSYGIKVSINPYLTRGFGYYTGNIFEIKEPGKSSIAAGGRYDKTVGKYLNREIPAVGISFGLERLSQLAKIDVKQSIKVLIISINQDKEAIKLSKKLRKSKIPCITTFGQPGKQLEYANSQNIPYAIFIGEEESKAKKFKLKEMSSGTEKLLTEKQILKTLGK